MRKTKVRETENLSLFCPKSETKWQGLDFNYLLARIFQTSRPQNKNATNEFH